MRHVIETEGDYNDLIGKIVIEIDSKNPDHHIDDFSWAFVYEKRLNLILSGYACVGLSGLWYRKFENFEEFKDWFNLYLFTHNKEKGQTDGGRFHRLLKSEEIDYLCKKLKEQIYQFQYYSSKPQRPNYIVCHPKTWVNLVEEFSKHIPKSFFLDSPSSKEGKIRYEGILVLRSYDLEENKFIVV